MILFICSNLCAQPGYYVDLAWHGKTTTMNYAYATYIDNGSGNEELQVYRDGFFSNQIFGHIGYWEDNNFARADLGGIFYLIGAEIGANNGTGIAKGKFRKFDNVYEENSDKIVVPTEYNSTRVHPITGGGDVRFLDVMGAWGNEVMKFGGHLGYGFLGANGGANGLSFSNGPLRTEGVQSFNLGFWEYGVNGMYHPLEDVDAYINLRISRLSRVSKRFEKRNGLGIGIEGHYRLGDGQFQPYATFRYQMRRMKGGKLEYFMSAPQPVELPALVSHTLSLGVGISLGFDK